MGYISYCCLLLVATLIIAIAQSPLPTPNIPSHHLHHGVPTYYIDPYILKLSQERYQQCNLHYDDSDKSSSSSSYKRFAIRELQYLYHQHSANEYFRAHELLAYQFFVEYRHQNPFYRELPQDAALEYIPILTLHWKHAEHTTASSSTCTYASFIQYLWTIWKHIQQRDNIKTAEIYSGKADSPSMLKQQQLPIKFFVSSTFNMRTEWGKGMSSINRKGDEYENISAFVMSLSVGHYERWPECPDLLRKWWKYVVELPYLDSSLHALQLYDFSSFDSNSQSPSMGKRVASSGTTSSNNQKLFNFLFAGSFELPGPERVCSVRNSLLSLASREDTMLVNVSIADSQTKGISGVITHLIEKSIFCLITSSQSYSTSFFYHAIQHDCIPVVIDDWFTFAFPWVVNYELFVIRINEEEFKANPNVALDYVLKRYKGFVGKTISEGNSADDDTQGGNNNGINDAIGGGNEFQHMKVLDLMRLEMRKAKQLLSFERYSYPYPPPTSQASNNGEKFYTVPVFEQMMQELVYAQQPYQYFNNIPCYRYYMCKPYTPKQLASLPPATKNNNNSTPRDYLFIDNKVEKTKLLSTVYSDVHPQQEVIYNNIFRANKRRPIQLHNDGYQASALFIPEKLLRDTRSHLCRNSKRLIGMYKMVYFMQCVRVLWPLQPGKFRNADNEARFSKPNYDVNNDNGPGIRKEDHDFVLAFHNLAHQDTIGGSWTNVVMYPWNDTAISYIKTLHDVEILYPLATRR